MKNKILFKVCRSSPACRIKQEHNNTQHKKKGFWSLDEDERLLRAVEVTGPKQWAKVAASVKTRIPKQCQTRWCNNLNPSVKHGGWTAEEDDLIEKMYRENGSKWAEMAKCLPNRTDNAIKNRFNCSIFKRFYEKKDRSMKLQLSIIGTSEEELFETVQQTTAVPGSSGKRSLSTFSDADSVFSETEEMSGVGTRDGELTVEEDYMEEMLECLGNGKNEINSPPPLPSQPTCSTRRLPSFSVKHVITKSKDTSITTCVILGVEPLCFKKVNSKIRNRCMSQ